MFTFHLCISYECYEGLIARLKSELKCGLQSLVLANKSTTFVCISADHTSHFPTRKDDDGQRASDR